MKRSAVARTSKASAPEPRHEPTAGRRLWPLWGGVGLILVGEFVDLAWHASHGEFTSGWDVVRGHWVSWLGLAVIVGVCLVALRRDSKARRGYLSVLAVSGVYTYGSVLNFWGHSHGGDTFVAHVFLFGSKVGILAAVAFTTHLLIGHDEHGGFFSAKNKKGWGRP
jgi:hypothetical protein